MINRKELKEAAKQQIKGNILVFLGVAVVIGLILSVSSFTFIGPLVLFGPLCLGFCMYLQEVKRTKKGNFTTSFNGFNQFGASFVATLLMFVFIFLWTLLLFIPGIIAGFRYSMTFFILADNPSMCGSQALKQSKKMMKGHKWELFVLYLSFFWWLLLSTITLGIAYIYVAPYMYVTFANYYEKLKEESTKQESQETQEAQA